MRVEFSPRGHVGVLMMGDTEHFNALSPPQVQAMLDALSQSKAARALVIASSAKHFCAGADIKEFLKGELLDPNRPAPATSPVNLFRALIDDPRPVIAAVDGLAMGGGVELTVSCDIVLASEKARFALPELGLGLVPRTALARLPEIIGRRKALELILTRRRVTADEAVALGLVNQKVDNPLEAALKLAEEVITAPPGAIAAVKRTLGRVPAGDWAGIHGLLANLDPAEWREGLMAFAEKRTPDFERFWKPAE
jgi:enoyl-CoA hydratase/carnithine racemase